MLDFLRPVAPALRLFPVTQCAQCQPYLHPPFSLKPAHGVSSSSSPLQQQPPLATNMQDTLPMPSPTQQPLAPVGHISLMIDTFIANTNVEE